MSYLTTKDHVHLYYKELGAGRPVILIHGWPLSADSFDDLSLAIAESGMRAISYDRRGFGRSDQPYGVYDYDTLADDLAAVIEHTGAQDAAILGFSMGGGEVARYMSRHQGNQVSKAILVSSVVPFMLKTDNNPDGVEQSAYDEKSGEIRQDRAKFWPEFFKTFYGVCMISQPVSDEVIDWSCQIAMQAGLHPTLACVASFSTTDFRPDLAFFKVPTLIIHGTSDKTVPIEIASRKAALGIANATLLEYDGAPHGLLASHKDRIKQDVLDFLHNRMQHHE